MDNFESQSGRRIGIVINYILLLAILFLSTSAHWLGWSTAIKIGFWLSVILVILTFFPIHIRTGLWRLVHTSAEGLDEREIQQNLESVRRAYVIFSIISLLIILALVIFDFADQTERLVLFWVLLYLAHTLPSSILAWTITQVPAQAEE